jgi:hypothetical protein
MGIRDRKVNRDKLAKDQQEAKARGGTSFLRFKDEGQYLLYLPPPCREEDDDIYLDVLVHNVGQGKSYKPVLCLDTVANLVLADDRMTGFLEKPIDLGDGCPRCEARETAKTDDAKRSIGRKHSYYMNGVLFGFRKDKRRDWDRVDESDLKVQGMVVGSTIWDGIIDVFLEDGDICDPSAAILIVVTRTGKGQTDTEYKVSTDRETLKNPLELPESLIEKLEEALQPGGSGDLYRMVARDLKSREEIAALLSGKKKVEVDEEGSDENEPPACFKLDYQDDDECGSCPFRGPCSKAADGPHGGELYEGHELRPGDLGYEDAGEEAEEEQGDPPPPKPATKRPAPAPASNRPTTPPPGPKPASGRASVSAPKPTAKPPATPPPKPAPKAHEKPKKKTDDEKLAELGYNDEQIGKMRKATKEQLIDERIPADCASILKSGAVKVFYEKLPTDHALYEEPEETQEETQEETRADPEPEPPKPAKRSKATKPDPDEEPEPDEEQEEIEEELPEEPGEGDDGSDGDDGLGLDDLERELNATAARTGGKK